jgi:hypothetical protein
MDEVKSYKTAGAFRAALETRLQMRARAEATDLQRLRRQVAFDRFLARMFSKGPRAAYPWLWPLTNGRKIGLRSNWRTKTLRTLGPGSGRLALKGQRQRPQRKSGPCQYFRCT